MTSIVAVVDDDEAILDAVEMVLGGYGWRVRTYASGETFLADLNGAKPDCVILDPHLPGMNGAEVARSIMDGNADIPIVGLTARPNSPVTIDVINAGARVMLMKPITAEELIEQVKAVMMTVGARPDVE